MKTALVTGASGFIGSNLVAGLLAHGYIVRAFHRKTSDTSKISGLEAEHVCGDVLDRESLQNAMIGCDIVFHTAALVSFWKGKRKEQFRVNVEGSRNVVEACLDSGIRSLIHTSSIAAIGSGPDGGIITEENRYNWGTLNTYRYSKYLSEEEVLKGVQRGLNAVIVNPSIVIGPGDSHIHGGRLIIDVKRGRIPAYTDGGTNIVSIHDVIEGHILAAERGRNGERYILSGKNFTHRELLHTIAECIGGRKPYIKIPRKAVIWVGKFFDMLGKLMKTEPPLTSQLAESIVHYNRYSSDKAMRELGYSPSPVEPAIIEAYEWYRNSGILE